MPKITFINFEGNQHQVDAQLGQSLMEAAIQDDVDGIDADCGGACACATCHVYINHDWTAKVGKPEDLEAEMLDVAEGVEDNSRLACQIEITAELDGLIVTTPESQF
ncbi:MAG: 2Fe-2S iron-sulfur cluster binding domain-containing protein [Arenicella sp.]|nr:2Fe-2S iron-sulfur cluster binding domain-containing protein [Arenicella sp.]